MTNAQWTEKYNDFIDFTLKLFKSYDTDINKYRWIIAQVYHCLKRSDDREWMIEFIEKEMGYPRTDGTPCKEGE